MNDYKFSHQLRELMARALPEDTSRHGQEPELRYTYLPATHAKALRPGSMLVVGNRGSGKSFWWSALQKPELRDAIGKDIGINRHTKVSTGFGKRHSPDDYPGKDTLTRLLEAFDTRSLWRTIVFKQVCGQHLPPEFNALTNWKNRVAWLKANPEPVEQIFFRIDNELASQEIYHLVLFDALDRTADNWKTMNQLVRGLLQAALDFRSYHRIRLKLFVRPDQIEDPAVAAFPDSSKLLSQKTPLYWPRNELYGLLWQHLANEPSLDIFREGCAKLVSANWQKVGDVWAIPESLRTDESLQRRVFHAMTGPWMGRDRRRGFPYSWLPNHLGDTKNQVSPKSFLSALRFAAMEKEKPDQIYALHPENIKRGVLDASIIRVREMQEDYPWVQKLLELLSGISVPCNACEINRIWEEKNILNNLEKSIETAAVRLPPAHIHAGLEGVLTDLENLGLIERLSDDRVNIPDVYRFGYGIGRHGGVKPAEPLSDSSQKKKISVQTLR